MSDPEQPSDNQYHQRIEVRDFGKAHIGNAYYNSQKNPLSRLPFAEKAPFNSSYRQHQPACLPNTRVDLLQQIYGWADGKDERRIFWLNGLAGTGKSTIARTVAQEYARQSTERRSCLGASFFFSKDDGDASHARKLVTSLARQLADNVPSVRQYITEACKRGDIATLALSEQWDQLVLSPLSKLESESPLSCILVIDALDECEDDRDVRIFLQLLVGARSLRRVQLRIFLTSRPEIPIRHGIGSIPQAEHQDFVLHNVHPSIVDHDISLFLEHNLGKIRQDWDLGANWPGGEVLRQLVLYACGLFIWAATACRFVEEGGEFAEDRLDGILQRTSLEGTPEQHLDEIYLTVLQNSIPPTYRALEKEKAYAIRRKVLGSIVVLLSPLSAASLAMVLSVPERVVTRTLEKLQAILEVPNDPTCQLRLHHPSFRDFLLNKDRCRNFWVDEKQAQGTLATRCIELMSKTLKKDICELHTPGYQVTQVESSRLQQCLPPEVQYACLYWVQHLQRSGSQAYNGDEAHRFLQEHLLHWLEALGWMGKTSEGIQAILSLEVLVSANESSSLRSFIHDYKRFVLYNKSVIEKTPLQLYCSAIIFAPENSIVKRQFKKEILPLIQIKSKVRASWSATLQTLEGHSSTVFSVAFSPDGKVVASGSDDDTVRLWDASTGRPLQTLEGDSRSVWSVAFSPDGKVVASGSGDDTVRLWDASTGRPLQTLEGHSSTVFSVAFSPDGKVVASGSYDDTVRLWDASTGRPLQTLESQESSHSITVLGNWVTKDKKPVLWLPPDYRPTSVAVWNKTIVIGHSSGGISIFQL